MLIVCLQLPAAAWHFVDECLACASRPGVVTCDYALVVSPIRPGGYHLSGVLKGIDVLLQAMDGQFACQSPWLTAYSDPSHDDQANPQ
jgi:hypothetical protein